MLHFPAMRIVVCLGAALLLMLLSSCQQPDEPAAQQDRHSADLFAAADMRIHPIFTQVMDWTGDNKPDGIEALVEFTDQFGDPTKATGKIMFELFEYRYDFPDPRGHRVVNPWIGSLLTADDQRAHWSRTTGTYRFQLAYPQIVTSRSYVLTATFERQEGGRYFDQIIIEAQPTSRPSADLPKVRTRGSKH